MNSMYDVMQLSPDVRRELDELEGLCVACFQHTLLVGYWKTRKALFYHEPDWNKAVQVHVFNEEREYRFVKASSDGSFRVRRRIDDLERPEHTLDEKMLIIGSQNQKELDENFIRAEEKGRAIILPKEAKGKAIKIRNYLSFDQVFDDPDPHAQPDADQLPLCEVMRVTDWRYVCFEDEEVKGGV